MKDVRRRLIDIACRFIYNTNGFINNFSTYNIDNVFFNVLVVEK